MNPNNVLPSKQCIVCRNRFFKKVNVSRKNWKSSKFCSRICKDKNLQGKPSWNKGLIIDRDKFPTMGHFQKHNKESLELITKKNKENAKKLGSKFYKDIQKLSIESGKKHNSYKGTLGKLGRLNYVWKDNQASYSSKHKWIQKHWKKTGICEHCKKYIKPFGNRKFGTEWSNKSGNYDRNDRNDWQEFCSKCHKEYDKRI